MLCSASHGESFFRLTFCFYVRMPGISIGAIPDIWRSVVRDTFGTEPFSASEMHYRKLQDLPTLPSTNGATKRGLTSPEDEYVATEGRLEDVAEVSSSRLGQDDTGSSVNRLY